MHNPSRGEDKNEKLIVVNSRCVTVARLQLQRIILQLRNGFLRGTRRSSIALLRWRGREKHDWKAFPGFAILCRVVENIARFILESSGQLPLSTKVKARLCITLRRRFPSKSCLNFGQARNTSRDISSASVTCNYA